MSIGDRCSNFNSRPSARGDCVGGDATEEEEGNFNSRPSARGDSRHDAYKVRATQISIHAPPRGATALVGTRRKKRREISIHAPPRGATRVQSVLYYNHKISIHAPPRGATEPVAATRGGTPISIHAPPRGATHSRLRIAWNSKFQFTPLREGRRGVISPLSSCVLFQFTPLREGRRRWRRKRKPRR